MKKPSIAERAKKAGLRMTPQRKLIAKAIDGELDHPDAEAVYAYASAIDERISLATVYRTLRQFEEHEIIDRHQFGDGKARYEDARRAHHDHLIDLDSGEVIEFIEPEIELLQEKIAKKLGYQIEGHRLELFGRKIK